ASMPQHSAWLLVSHPAFCAACSVGVLACAPQNQLPALFPALWIGGCQARVVSVCRLRRWPPITTKQLPGGGHSLFVAGRYC
ncbi:hypothetical protein V8C86DRAFT_2482220, partial [Haematococcus lacustris]